MTAGSDIVLICAFVADFVVIRIILHTDGCTDEIGTLIGAVQRSVAKVIVISSCTYAPLRSYAIGGMKPCGEIYKEPTTDELVIDIIDRVVLKVGITYPRAERVVGRPALMPEKGASKEQVGRDLIAETRVVIDHLRESPCRV